MTIPNTIVIYVKSNILGFSNFKLKPSMLDPSNKNDNILFDPLVKLNQNIVNSFEEDKRKSLFVQKPLFNSLIVKSESFQPYRSLKEATKAGLIDNNINVMLNTFFPQGGTIYLKDKPYSVINLGWKKGNWKIDTKLPSRSKISNQYPINSIYYQHTMNSYYNNAVFELNQIPDDIREGKNFVPEDFQASPQIMDGSPLQQQAQITGTPTYPALPPSNPQQAQLPAPQSYPALPPTQQQAQLPAPQSYPALPPPQQQQQQQAQLPATPNYPVLPPSNPRLQVQQQNPIPNRIRIEPTAPPNAQQPDQLQQQQQQQRNIRRFINRPIRKKINFTRRRGTNQLGIGRTNELFKLKKYFNAKNYYLLVKYIFNYLTPSEKEFVYSNSKKCISYQTPPNRSGIYELNYTQTLHSKLIETLNITNLPESDNSFLDSIAYLLNKNSPSINQSSQNILENTFNYIQSNEDILNILLSVANQKATLLNDKFTEMMNAQNNANLTEDLYLNNVNEIFGENDHYLVIKPTMMNNDERLEKPFTFPQNYNELKTYLLANKQFYDRLYSIIEIVLNTKILVIQNIDNQYQFPFQDLSTETNMKYLFLFLQNDIYFPMDFKFKINNQNSPKYIFDENQMDLFPPIGILLFIFGSCKIISWVDINEKNYLLKNIFNSMYKSVNQIFFTYNIENFIQTFNNYFPDSLIRLGGSKQIGGQPPPPPQGQVNTIPQVNRSPYLGRPTNIAYYITITLYLAPGKDLSTEDINKIKCQMRKDNINKSWADIRNIRYSPQPIT